MRKPSFLAFFSTSTSAVTSVLSLAAAIILAPGALSQSAYAAGCASPATFPAWLQSLKQEAIAQGISPQVVSEALDGLTYDPAVIAKDRGQAVFAQSFLQFSGRMVNSNRLSLGSALLKKNAATFARIQQEYGVPGPVLVGFWGLETDFGKVMGNMRRRRHGERMAGAS
jgi:membrane-bound lytic murein transglycosylase B